MTGNLPCWPWWKICSGGTCTILRRPPPSPIICASPASPSAVANKLRLLRLSPACREILVRNRLSERHARCLLRLEDEQERLAAARYMAQKELNVAQAEQYIERRLAALQSVPPAGRRTFILKDVRLFLNSLDRGLRLIREAGVDAQSGREETEDAIVLTIRIPKQRRPKT